MAREAARGGKGELSAAQIQKFQMIADEIERQRPILENLLGGDVGWDAFMRSVTTALRGNGYILNLPPASIVQACFEAAQDRLLPDGVQGAIVPRYNWRTDATEAKWQPMYQGLLIVAKKYAGVRSIDAELVFEGEHFLSVKGTSPRIEHVQDVSKFDLSKIVAAYCVVWFNDGTYKSEVMDRAALDEVRKSSEPVKRGRPTPWVGPFAGEMYRKTVMRRAWKWVPATGENAHIVANAIQRIDGEQAGMREHDTLAAAGIALPQITASDPMPNLGAAFGTGMDKLDMISDQLAALHSRDAVEVWLLDSQRSRWMDGLRRNQPGRYSQVRTLIDQHLAAIDPDSRDSGAVEAEGLPFFAPSPDDDSAWSVLTVQPYDGMTLPEAYVQYWREVLRRYPHHAERMQRENFPHFRMISAMGNAYDAAVVEVSKLVDKAKEHAAKLSGSQAA